MQCFLLGSSGWVHVAPPQSKILGGRGGRTYLPKIFRSRLRRSRTRLKRFFERFCLLGVSVFVGAVENFIRVLLHWVLSSSVFVPYMLRFTEYLVYQTGFVTRFEMRFCSSSSRLPLERGACMAPSVKRRYSRVPKACGREHDFISTPEGIST